jgi:hypothetical protein
VEDSLTNPIKEAIAEGEILKDKEYELRKTRVDIQYSELTKRQEQQNAFDVLPIGENIATRAASLSIENEEYIKLAKEAATFLSMKVFKDKVALFPRNIILFGAETGTGKSTTVANFVESYIKQGKRVLVITNEEYSTDILNRVIFLLNNWAYTNHDEVTPEQLAKCNELYPILMKRIEIIDDKFNGIGGTTTTLEGIQAICNTLVSQMGTKPTYDAIVIDYVQNIKTSIEIPNLAQWMVLDRLGTFLDNWKGSYPAPILLFSQLKASNGDNDSFKDRIEKFKAVMNHATTAIEVKADRENLRTEWIFRKNRFKGAVGISVITGYDKGRYINYSQDFMTRTRVRKEAKKHAELMGNIFNEGENNEN